MNTPTQSDPVMEMARKIVADLWSRDFCPNLARCVREGEYDESRPVRSVVAAIRATTEAAAAWHDEQYAMIPDEGRKSLSSHPKWAIALRANHHLKGSDDAR